MKELHGTTVIAVRRGPRVAIAADGQVTLGNTVIKHGAKKTRRLHDGSIVAGFAGGTADAFALFEHFEAKLKDHSGNLTRAAVELAKDWRTDRILRRLEAMLVVADASKTLLLTGSGDVVEPDGGAVGIGSGGAFAQSAASALLTHTALDPAQIAREALRIASEICIYTNQHVSLEELGASA